MDEGDGVDQGIRQRELVLDEEIGSRDRDFLVDADHDAGTHRKGDFVRFRMAAFLESDLPDLRDHDGRDYQLGQLQEDGAEMRSVRAVVEALAPRARIEDVQVHVRIDCGELTSCQKHYSLKFEHNEEKVLEIG